MKRNKLFIILLVVLLIISGYYIYRHFHDSKNEPEEPEAVETIKEYHFRNEKLFNSHYEKHGIDMGFDSREEYEKAANDVINNPNALHKKEKEDNDDVYFIEKTGEIVFVSSDGYIRTYFISDLNYFNRQ